MTEKIFKTLQKEKNAWKGTLGIYAVYYLTMGMYAGNVRIYASTLGINQRYILAQTRYNAIRSRFSKYNKLLLLALLL